MQPLPQVLETSCWRETSCVYIPKSFMWNVAVQVKAKMFSPPQQFHFERILSLFQLNKLLFERKEKMLVLIWWTTSWFEVWLNWSNTSPFLQNVMLLCSRFLDLHVWCFRSCTHSFKAYFRTALNRAAPCAVNTAKKLLIHLGNKFTPLLIWAGANKRSPKNLIKQLLLSVLSAETFIQDI